MDYIADHLQYRIPLTIRSLIGSRETTKALADELINLIPASLVKDRVGNDPRAVESTPQYAIWDDCLDFYLYSNRPTEGLSVAHTLYEHLLQLQSDCGVRFHKGDMLWMLGLLYERDQSPWMAQWYKNLALCEDAVTFCNLRNDGPRFVPFFRQHAASYAMLQNRFRYSEADIERLLLAIRTESDPGQSSMFPETLLANMANIDRRYFDECGRCLPSVKEACLFAGSQHYMRRLVESLGEGDGLSLERLALYLMSCIPGTRAVWNSRSTYAQHDVFGSFEGSPPDFRSDTSRYFLCECKDYSRPVDSAKLSTFADRMSSTRVKFGVLFSMAGLTGTGTRTNGHANRERAYTVNEQVIAVITHDDLMALCDGRNFLDILKSEYEFVRFSIPR
jgi:hypothetical protein